MSKSKLARLQWGVSRAFTIFVGKYNEILILFLKNLPIPRIELNTTYPVPGTQIHIQWIPRIHNLLVHNFINTQIYPESIMHLFHCVKFIVYRAGVYAKIIICHRILMLRSSTWYINTFPGPQSRICNFKDYDLRLRSLKLVKFFHLFHSIPE